MAALWSERQFESSNTREGKWEREKLTAEKNICQVVAVSGIDFIH